MSRRIGRAVTDRGPELHDGRGRTRLARGRSEDHHREGRDRRRRLPRQAHARRPGPTTFKVTNEGSGDVSEFEVLSGNRIIGEVENIAPGLSGEFSLTLKAGDYTTACPGGSKHAKGKLAVTGTAATKLDAQQKAAVEPVPRLPRRPERATRHRDEGVHRRGRQRQRRSRQAALPGGADPVRADRAGGRDVRRPRSRHRRPRGRRAQEGMGRVPRDRAGALGRRLHEWPRPTRSPRS